MSARAPRQHPRQSTKQLKVYDTMLLMVWGEVMLEHPKLAREQEFLQWLRAEYPVTSVACPLPLQVHIRNWLVFTFDPTATDPSLCSSESTRLSLLYTLDAVKTKLLHTHGRHLEKVMTARAVRFIKRCILQAKNQTKAKHYWG